jgi:hypothetical protein
MIYRLLVTYTDPSIDTSAVQVGAALASHLHKMAASWGPTRDYDDVKEFRVEQNPGGDGDLWVPYEPDWVVEHGWETIRTWINGDDVKAKKLAAELRSALRHAENCGPR